MHFFEISLVLYMLREMYNYSKFQRSVSQKIYKMCNTLLSEEAPYSEMLFTIQKLMIDILNY